MTCDQIKLPIVTQATPAKRTADFENRLPEVTHLILLSMW